MVYERCSMMFYVYWPMLLVTLLRREGVPIEAARAALEQEGDRGDAA